MQNFKKYLPYIILGVSSVFFVLFAILSKGDCGGADSYVHYRISRYAFKYPTLFLDLWGKPVFNILSSPFSQFGFLGIKIFNVLVALLSSWIVYDIARMNKWHASYMAILMLLFAPIYFIVIPSGLTEPLFGLVLITAVWLFFKDRFLLSSIVISFLPFARNEGIVILPLFLLGYLLKRKYLSIPFLCTGFVFFSLAGWAIYHDILWIISRFIGPGDYGLYGSGSLWHFVNSINEILGIPILLLWLIGFGFSSWMLFKNFKNINQEHYFYLIVVGGFLAYFSAHSVVWWLGTGGSLGLIRVVAGVVPLASLMALRGLHEILDRIEQRKLLSTAFICLTGLIIVWFPFNMFQIPQRIGEAETLIESSCEWLKSEKLDHKLIYFYDPLIPHYLGKDPFDPNEVHELVDDHENPQNGIPVDAIIIWDAHFGPNEGRLPLDRLMNNDSFELLKKVAPEHPFTTINEYNYEIYIFRRK